MPLYNIKKRLLTIAPNIFANTPVLFAYLYGSVALDQAHPFSDLDIAVNIGTQLSLKESLSLELSLSLEIDKQMEIAPPCDVRIMNHLPLVVAGQIITDGIMIYCRDDDFRIDCETSLRGAYFDFLPSLRIFQGEYLQHMDTIADG
ncbi:MAG: hypothetical protein COX19_08975 [Desulfobacterales bacterium CG23_combo_of_CG06-09_8_20_14_all_51_8]|nr:MAG: hypothetical protein COX19_08975 [Desulfobacterales bacterium CG23_combo_of_CG06-09_8_20_14_all_51_8]